MASSYALDVSVSNDNKFLAIAEIDTEGIKIQSTIKIIRIDNINNQKIKSVKLATDILVTDIEYRNDGKLLVLADNSITLIDEQLRVIEIINYEKSNIVYASIENGEDVIIVRKTSQDMFGIDSLVEIYNNDNEKKEYILKGVPQNIYVQNKTIAINMENEILFIDTNGKLIKRYLLDTKLKDMVMYDNGNMAALVFKDKIELVKI